MAKKKGKSAPKRSRPAPKPKAAPRPKPPAPKPAPKRLPSPKKVAATQKRVQRQVKIASKDGKITNREAQKIQKLNKPGLNIKPSIKKAIASVKGAGKNVKVGSTASVRLKLNKKGVSKILPTENPNKPPKPPKVDKPPKNPTRIFKGKFDKKKPTPQGEGPLQSNQNKIPTNNTSKDKPSRNKNKSDKTKPLDIKTAKDLDDYLNKDVTDKELIKPDNISGKKWEPSKVENNVAKQWGSRFSDTDGFKPKRLKVNTPNTPERIQKYTDKKGNFNTDQYVSDIRSQMASRAKKRGLKGDALKALQRNAPSMPKEAKPKYGGAIESLRKQFSDINYSKKIRETKSKLTEDVKSGAAGFKKTGMSLLKKRSSEDGGIPMPISQTAKEPQRDRMKARNNKAWKQATKKTPKLSKPFRQ